MVQHAVVIVTLFEVTQVLGTPRVYYVVSDHHCPLLDAAPLLQPPQVAQIQFFEMVDEDEVEGSVVFDEGLLSLYGAEVDGDAVVQTRVGVESFGDIGHILVGLDGVDLRL